MISICFDILAEDQSDSGTTANGSTDESVVGNSGKKSRRKSKGKKSPLNKGNGESNDNRGFFPNNIDTLSRKRHLNSYNGCVCIPNMNRYMCDNSSTVCMKMSYK